MPDKVIYEYAIIRVVPKVEREEFINVGVMLMAKRQHYLGIKYQLDKKRLLAFSPELDLDLIAEHLKAWELICAGGPESGPIGALELHVRFRWLTANRSTIIQCSEVHPGRYDDQEQMLEKLFERYVL